MSRAVLKRYGGRRSIESRKLMARRIAELEQTLERVRSARRVIIETGLGRATVVFAADLDRVLEGKP